MIHFIKFKILVRSVRSILNNNQKISFTVTQIYGVISFEQNVVKIIFIHSLAGFIHY